jgi:hypothetical protein
LVFELSGVFQRIAGILVQWVSEAWTMLRPDMSATTPRSTKAALMKALGEAPAPATEDIRDRPGPLPAQPPRPPRVQPRPRSVVPVSEPFEDLARLATTLHAGDSLILFTDGVTGAQQRGTRAVRR